MFGMLKVLFRCVLYQCVGIIAYCGLVIVSANAADITLGEYDFITFEGKIVKGDYEKLNELSGELAALWHNNPDRYQPINLALFSPGGDVAEAMKIGRLVRALRWMTTAPEDDPGARKWHAGRLKAPEENYMCASACFFIFVAGIDRYSGYRSYVAPLILGIHRPYFSDVELKAMSSKDAIVFSG
jgi:hypothetical protein